MKRALFLLAAILCADSAWGLTLSAEVKPKTATIGDRLEYTITAEGTGNAELPKNLENTGSFELLDAKREAGNGRQKIIFILTVFKTGKLKLPPYKVAWKEKGDLKDITSPEVFVEIASVLKSGDAAPKLMEIEPVMEPEYDWRGLAVTIGIIILIAAIAIMVYRYIKNRPAPPPPPPPPVPAITPYEAAMKKLERVRADNRYDKGEVKEYFAQVADVVREYLRDEYGLDATEKTTMEMEGLWPPMLHGLREKGFFIFRTADEAKFAKIIPTRDDATRALEEAFYFVKYSPKVNSRQKEPV